MYDYDGDPRPSAGNGRQKRAQEALQAHIFGDDRCTNLRSTLHRATGAKVFKKGGFTALTGEDVDLASKLADGALVSIIDDGIREMLSGDVEGQALGALRRRVAAHLSVLERRKEPKNTVVGSPTASRTPAPVGA